MAYEHKAVRYRRWYARLLRLYPKPYRERFGEGMEQTFNDLCRERSNEKSSWFSFIFWVFVETSAGIIRENINFMIMQNKTRLIVWAMVAMLVLLIPVAMQFPPFTEEVQVNEAVAYAVILLIVGCTYELWQWLKMRSKTYRIAFCIGLLGALLLGWVNGAVGIIGNEDNTANLLYGAVFAVGLIGSLLSRFKARGMAYTLFTAAFIQFTIPVVALIMSPDVSWGNAGVIGVFVFNSIFAVLFLGSGLLFRRASNLSSKQTP